MSSIAIVMSPLEPRVNYSVSHADLHSAAEKTESLFLPDVSTRSGFPLGGAACERLRWRS